MDKRDILLNIEHGLKSFVLSLFYVSPSFVSK